MCDRETCHLGEDECTADLHDEQESIEYEMAYTSWEQSCKEAGMIYESHGEKGFRLVERACRRQRNHQDKHASGYGLGFRTW